MSLIGRDTIEVVYDGRGLPAEAEALGHETGRSQADAHNKEFDERVAEGQSRTGQKLEKDWETLGKQTGERHAISFNQAFGDLTRQKMDGVAREVAKVFSDDGGLDAYRAKLGEVGQGYDGVGHSADSLQAKIRQLYDNKQIDYNLFRRLSTDVRTWASNAEQAEAAAASTRGAMRNLGEEIRGNLINHLGALDDEMDRAHLAAIDLNQEYESTDAIVKRVGDAFDGTGRNLKGADRAMRDLERTYHDADLFTQGARDAATYGKELDKLPRSVRNASAAFQDGKIALSDLEKVAGTGVGDLDKLGRAFDDVGKKAGGGGGGGGSGAIGLWTGAIIALIGLIIALLPEMAALGSALGALTLEGGLAFGALVVGAGAFVVAMKGMFGKLDQLPAAVRPAAAALQSIFGKDDAKGKFQAGGMLTEIQTILQTQVFENLAGAIQKVSTNAFPAFKTGAISVGNALHNILSEFANSFVDEPNNLKNFQVFLVGLGPTLQALGSAAIDFGQGLSGIFAAATPFALEFAKHLHDMAESFGDFFSQQKGQDQVVLWLQNADKIAPHLGGAFVAIGVALHEMVTPQSITNTNLILDSIGRLALAIGQLGVAVTPAAVGISVLLDLISRILVDFGPGISAILDGVSSFLVGFVKMVSPVVDFLATTVVNPIMQIIQAFLNYMGTAMGVAAGNAKGIFGGLSAALKPLISLIVTGFVNAFKIMGEVLQVAKPAVDGLGSVFLALGSAVGSIIGTFFTVGGKVLDFKGKANDLQSFIHGPLASAFTVLGGKLKDFADWITNTAVPYIRGQLIPAFQAFWANIRDNILPAFQEFLPKLSDFASFLTTKVIPAIEKIDFGKLINGLIILGTDLVALVDIFGNIISVMAAMDLAAIRWGQNFVATVQGILTVVGGLGGVLMHLAVGDFAGAATLSVQAFHQIGTVAGDMAHSFNIAMVATGKAVATFGVSTGNMVNDVHTMLVQGQSAFNQLSATGQTDLGKLASNLNVTGVQAGAFKDVLATATNGSKSQLAALARDRSLGEVEHTLGLTGDAARAFEAKLATAMTGAAGESDNTKKHVTDLHTSISNLPGGKTIVVHQTGAQAATDAAKILKASIDALHDKTIQITASYNPGKSFYGGGADPFANAFGGVIAGGRQIAGGRAFAVGGLVNAPTWLGQSLVGEAGPEAIVPLTGPLSQVDPSVRELAMIARGLSPYATATGSAGKNVTIAPGAIQVTEAGNGRTTASAVLDRLAAKLGG